MNTKVFVFLLMSRGAFAATPEEDFLARCSQPGVTVCESFDTVVHGNWPNSGLYPISGTQIYRGFADTSIKTSGNASLRFDIPPFSGSDVAGQWFQDLGASFGEGESFYVQFRQRFSPEMMSLDWDHLAEGNDATSWKQIIFHHGSDTYAKLELTAVRQMWTDEDLPIMYVQMAERGVFVDGATGPIVQQGDYTCMYPNYSSPDCFHYPADTWLTFYFEVHIGTWGGSNSTIRAYVAETGQPLKKWIDVTNFVLNHEPATEFDHLTITPYATNKDASRDHCVAGQCGLTARTWYDELIVSSQPIAPPQSSNSQDVVAPAAPYGLVID